jgi:hypothetical protein
MASKNNFFMQRKNTISIAQFFKTLDAISDMTQK